MINQPTTVKQVIIESIKENKGSKALYFLLDKLDKSQIVEIFIEEIKDSPFSSYKSGIHQLENALIYYNTKKDSELLDLYYEISDENTIFTRQDFGNKLRKIKMNCINYLMGPSKDILNDFTEVFLIKSDRFSHYKVHHYQHKEVLEYINKNQIRLAVKLYSKLYPEDSTVELLYE